MIRLELCTDGLSVDDRENILDVIWQRLRIAPGMISADGDYELLLSQCGTHDASLAPVLKVNERIYEKLTLERLDTILPKRRR